MVAFAELAHDTVWKLGLLSLWFLSGPKRVYSFANLVTIQSEGPIYFPSLYLGLWECTSDISYLLVHFEKISCGLLLHDSKPV